MRVIASVSILTVSSWFHRMMVTAASERERPMMEEKIITEQDLQRWRGLPVYIVSDKDNGDQVRTHKKKRINKKWRKRYGLVSTPFEKGQCSIAYGIGIFMSKKTYNALKRGMKQNELDKQRESDS